MKGFKAFRKGMICRGKQYAENTIYEENGAEACCNQGVMHYCDEPFDVWDYYPVVDKNGDFTEYAEVEPLDKVLVEGNKRATKKLHIGARLSFKGFVEAAVNVIIDKTKFDDAAKIGSSGYSAQIGSSGRYAQIGSSGDAAQIGSSGYSAQIGSSGDAAKIGSSGRYAQIGSSGDAAKIKCEADHAVVVCGGKRGRINAPVGTWITLAEYGDYDGEGYPCICVKSAQIDGETIKADTWYTLKGGEFVEVSDDD